MIVVVANGAKVKLLIKRSIQIQIKIDIIYLVQWLFNDIKYYILYHHTIPNIITVKTLLAARKLWCGSTRQTITTWPYQTISYHIHIMTKTISKIHCHHHHYHHTIPMPKRCTQNYGKTSHFQFSNFQCVCISQIGMTSCYSLYRTWFSRIQAKNAVQKKIQCIL